MMSLFMAVFGASLLGSLHCAGMCGAFVAIACGVTNRAQGDWRGATVLQGAYHAGRLISYMSLGAAAGVAGSLLNLAGALAGLQTAAMVVAGAGVATFGILSLLRASGVPVTRFHLPPAWTKRVSRLSGHAMNRPPLARAAMIGLLTTLLPCGWLYAFAVTAAGTGSAPLGALTMAAFWAGTLPALAAVGVGVRKLAGPLGSKMPVLTASAMVLVGVWMFAGRGGLDPLDLARQVHADPVAAQTEKPACCVESP